MGAVENVSNEPGSTEAVETEAVQPETDWKAEARKWETRAKENLAKASENSAAAQRLAEIEEANKTEAEKAQARAEAAERRASELEAKVLKADVAADKGVPAALLSGSTREELEAAADALLAFRGEVPAGPKPPYVPAQQPGQGHKPAKSVSAGVELFEASRKK